MIPILLNPDVITVYALTRSACSLEHRKRGARTKGKPCYPRSLRLLDADCFRYIKELAERVEVLEARHPIPSVPGYPYAAYNEYSPHPEEPGYGLNKRSSSMSERVQTSPYMQDHQIPGDAIGRYSDQIQAGDAIGRYQVTRGVQGNLVYSSTPHNTTDQQAPMNSPHTPQSFIQQGNHHLTPGDNPAMEVQLNDQMDYPSEWDEYPIDEYVRAS